jgi:hypothetical protein
MMNPYQIPVTCDVCGEPGYAHVNDPGSEWFGDRFRHHDGHVCAANLKITLEKVKKIINAETK